MAYNKEALAILLDVGPGMSNGPAGESNELQVSLNAINMILQRKLLQESKDEVALVLFGTNDTANDLANDTDYRHITVARPLGVVDWDLLQYVQNDIRTGDQPADFLDAIIVTMSHLIAALHDDKLDDIMGALKEKDFELNVIGPDLDDDEDDEDDDQRMDTGASNGCRDGRKPKTAQQRAGETLLRHMIDTVNGESYSFDEALPALSYFQSRQIRSAAWKQDLEIGSSLKIPIALYCRIKAAKPKSFKNVYAKDPDANIEALRTHHLNDDEETEVDKTDTVDGHRYGSTLVPFSADDKEAMKYPTEKCFKVLGFTKTENVKRYQIMGDSSSVCVAQKESEAAVVALSALINALFDTNMVAIVRRVYAKNGAVKLGCLMPKIKSKYECLYYFELAFNEDLRQFTFGSLPINEALTPANKKFAPSDDQLEAVDELITAMDLASSDGDDEGDLNEAMKPKLTFNPYLQRLYQCLQHRAFAPDEGLPDLSPLVAQSLKPPADVAARVAPVIEKMKDLFKLKPAVKKTTETGENMFRDDTKDEPDAKRPRLDAPADLTGVALPDLLKAQVTEVGSATPVEDFEALIARKDRDHFSEAHTMMCKRIVQLITESFGTQFFQKAIDCLKALRDQSIKNMEPDLFNNFIRELKTKVTEIGRTNFWSLVVNDKLTLITKSECEASSVTTEIADSFLSDVSPENNKHNNSTEDGPDADNLLAEME